MSENELSTIIVDVCYHIHCELGPGLLELIYEEVLAFELAERSLFVSRQQIIPIIWKQMKMDQGFRADIIVENKVLIELKSIREIAPVHKKQVPI